MKSIIFLWNGVVDTASENYANLVVFVSSPQHTTDVTAFNPDLNLHFRYGGKKKETKKKKDES
jgi:hypothetical protein